MILVSLLVVSVLISLSTSTTHRRRDVEESSWNYAEVPEPWNSEQLYLYSILNAWTEAPKIDNNSDSSIDREKKMGSLSISNPMDVLRQRFILELARRQQLQQQQQIKANRELLKDIGKRSTQRLGIIYPRVETRNRQVLQRQPVASQVSSDYPNWSRMDRLNWYNVGNSGDRSIEADQSSKLETNELRLL